MQVATYLGEADDVKAGVKIERGRKKHIRTRTGCFTCRRRKKKCDEAKPACRNCLRVGVTCDGYPANVNAKSQSDNKLYSNDSYDTPDSESYGSPNLEQPTEFYLNDDQLAIDAQRRFAMVSKSNLANDSTWHTGVKEFTSSEEYLTHVDSIISSRRARHSNVVPTPLLNKPLPNLIDGVSSPLQRRLFHYFVTHVARVSCIFGSIPSECPFLSLVTPMAVQNRFMMDAVLYLSATHMISNIGQSRMNPSFFRQLGVERVKTYEKALKNASDRLALWETALLDDNLLVISLLLFADMCYGEIGGSGPGHVAGLYTLLVEKEQRRLISSNEDLPKSDDFKSALSGTMTGLSRLSLRRKTTAEPVDRYLYDIFHYCHTSLTITLSPRALKEYLPFKDQAALRRAAIKRQTLRQASAAQMVALDDNSSLSPPIPLTNNNNITNATSEPIWNDMIPEIFNDDEEMASFAAANEFRTTAVAEAEQHGANPQMVEALRGIASGIFDIIEEICALLALVDEKEIAVKDEFQTHAELTDKLDDTESDHLSSAEAMAWAVELEQKIHEWQPNNPNAHWTLILLADIHRLCAFICLYRVLHPKDALIHTKLQAVIDEAIRLIYELPPNQPTESVMVFPLFIFGCSAVLQDQRDKIIDRYMMVRNYIGFQNIELAIEVIKECWRRWDNGLPGWDWQTVLEEKDWKLLLG